MRTCLLLPVLLGCAACAVSRPDIIQVGPWFPARPAEEVSVFASKEETARPWGAIAVIHSERIPAGKRSAIDRQKELARELAAGAGADGIIMAEEAAYEDPLSDKARKPEVYISALAFKYVTEISTAAR